MQRLCWPLALVVAGCASEPLLAPQAPAADRYTAGPRLERTGPASGVPAQSFVYGQDIPGQWWTLFRSPELDALVRQALEGSPTLARAGAKLRQAQEDRSARDGARLPQVDAKLSANRVDLDPRSLDAPALPIATPFNLFFAGVSVSYDFDFFGATRHELAALQAEVDRQGHELRAAQLTLAANVVTAAIREASLRERIALAREIVALHERQLGILERLARIGTASEAQVSAQRAELARSRAALPDLQRDLDHVRHRLAVYTGQPPGAARLPEFRLESLQLPAQLPVTLPSELARRRPDIRAAEALLHQAGERVGVATAHLYPRIALSANVGSLAAHAGDLFGGGTAFYLLGASLAQPLFRGGELQARRRAAIAAYEQASAAWREAVLRGLQEVADVLRALEHDAQRLRARAEVAAEAARQRDILVARHRAGGVSDYAVIEAERQVAAARLERTQAEADRLADSAALLQALGGGWQDAP
jgi:NodT family efflux transporter outer membrane factor (OMF) lipoprotein